MPGGKTESPTVPTPAGTGGFSAVRYAFRTPGLYVGFLSLAVGATIARQGWGTGMFVPGMGPTAMAFPLVIGITFLIVGLLLAARALMGVDPGEPVVWPDRAGAIQVLGMLVAAALYIALLERVGFLLSSLVLGVVVMRLLSHYRWWSIVLLALAIAVVASLVFETLLRVDLPAGSLITLPWGDR